MIILFIGCEQAIEIDLPTNQINTENVFKDKRIAEGALANLYASLRDKSMFTPNGLSIRLGLHTDELMYVGNSLGSEYALLYNNTYESTILSSIWSSSYSNLYAINTFILGVKDSEVITENEKQNLLGEAHILRCLYYQNLLQLFGDIPYTTSIDHKINSKLKKTKSEDVLKLIEQDLLNTLDQLTYTDRSPKKFYPNKAVSELMLAKNYLLQGNYIKAEEFAKKLYDNTTYKLENDINQVFKNNASSTIWQLSNTNLTYPTQEASSFIINYSTPQHTLSDDLYNSFEAQDQRKENWIGMYAPIRAHFNYKYKNRLPPNSDENTIMFRIEEAYFILAESLIHQNRQKEAIPIINLIRHRAGLLSPININLNKDEALLAMLNESRKEFFLEHGRRFFDLKRNNMLQLLISVKPNWKPKHAYFPFPEKEILMNPNLNPQNEY